MKVENTISLFYTKHVNERMRKRKIFPDAIIATMHFGYTREKRRDGTKVIAMTNRSIKQAKIQFGYDLDEYLGTHVVCCPKDNKDNHIVIITTYRDKLCSKRRKKPHRTHYNKAKKGAGYCRRSDKSYRNICDLN